MNTSAATRDPVATGGGRRLLPRWRAARGALAQAARRIEPHGQAVVLLALRLLYGGLFAQTGWGKLTHLERTAGFFEGLGLPAPEWMAALVGGVELAGGLLLVAGLGTRFAAAALSTVMVTALATAHASEAFASIEKLTEQAPYPFLVATVILLAFGAGSVSVDGWLRRRVSKAPRERHSQIEDPRP